MKYIIIFAGIVYLVFVIALTSREAEADTITVPVINGCSYISTIGRCVHILT